MDHTGHIRLTTAPERKEVAVTNLESPRPSYYERIGGAESIKIAVEKFYNAVLGDARLAPYFTDVDLVRLKRHQVAMLTTVFGGPNAYEGRELGTAHAGMGITGDDYDLVCHHLVSVLQDLDVPADAIAHAGGVLTAVKSQIVESPRSA